MHKKVSQLSASGGPPARPHTLDRVRSLGQQYSRRNTTEGLSNHLLRKTLDEGTGEVQLVRRDGPGHLRGQSEREATYRDLRLEATLGEATYRVRTVNARARFFLEQPTIHFVTALPVSDAARTNAEDEGPASGSGSTGVVFHMSAKGGSRDASTRREMDRQLQLTFARPLAY